MVYVLCQGLSFLYVLRRKDAFAVDDEIDFTDVIYFGVFRGQFDIVGDVFIASRPTVEHIPFGHRYVIGVGGSGVPAVSHGLAFDHVSFVIEECHGEFRNQPLTVYRHIRRDPVRTVERFGQFLVGIPIHKDFSGFGIGLVQYRRVYADVAGIHDPVAVHKRDLESLFLGSAFAVAGGQNRRDRYRGQNQEDKQKF